MPSQTRLELAPGIHVPVRLGPLHTQLHLGTRHHVWLPDAGSIEPTATHLAAMEISIRIPLSRSFKTFRHLIEPFLRYRLTPWQSGENPPWVVDDFDRLRTGQELDVGILTRFDRMRSPTAFLRVAERIVLPGFGDSFNAAYLHGTAAAGPDWLRLSIDASWDHKQNKPSTAGLTLSSRHKEQNRIEFGSRWVGPGLGPHVDRPFAAGFGPWLVTPWPDEATQQLEVFENLQVSLTPRFSARIGSRIGVWPESVLHALWYGVEFRTICGCLTAGLIASHRLASYVPDVLFTFSLAGL